MDAKRLTFTALVLAVLGGFLSGCRRPPEQSPPALVCSIPWQDDAFSAKVGMTDSLVYELKIKVDTAKAQLIRVPLANPAASDSFYFPPYDIRSIPATIPPEVPMVYDYPFSRKHLGSSSLILPDADQILLPVPAGDTSEMIQIGRIEAESYTREVLERKLRDAGLLFYVVDLSSSPPRTLAAIEGLALDAASGYILIQTGFKYKSDSLEYAPGKVDVTNARFVVIDLSTLVVSADIPLRIPDECLWIQSVAQYARLTPNGELLERDRISLSEGEYGERKIYLLDKKMIIDELEGLKTIDSVTRRQTKLLDLLHVPRHSLAEDWIFHFNIADRRSVELGPTRMTVWNLQSRQSSHMESFLPYDIFTRETGIFSDRGTSRFISPSSEGWGYSRQCLPRGFPFVPLTIGIGSYPEELRWFRKFTRNNSRLDWELSPEKRWLVLYLLGKKQQLKEAVLIPVQALSDSTLMEDEDLRRVPMTEDKTLRFVPGERWVLVQESYDEGALLYACESNEPPLFLASPDETGVRDVFFSPDGRYAGYVCRITGRPGYFFQVRLLPE